MSDRPGPLTRRTVDIRDRVSRGWLQLLEERDQRVLVFECEGAEAGCGDSGFASVGVRLVRVVAGAHDRTGLCPVVDCSDVTVGWHWATCAFGLRRERLAGPLRIARRLAAACPPHFQQRGRSGSSLWISDTSVSPNSGGAVFRRKLRSLKGVESGVSSLHRIVAARTIEVDRRCTGSRSLIAIVTELALQSGDRELQDFYAVRTQPEAAQAAREAAVLKTADWLRHRRQHRHCDRGEEHDACNSCELEWLQGKRAHVAEILGGTRSTGRNAFPVQALRIETSA
jgi:hypothetical protein